MAATTTGIARNPVPEVAAETWVFWGIFILCLIALATNARAGPPARARKTNRAADAPASGLAAARAVAGLWTTIAAPAALLAAIPLIAQGDREVFNDLRLELDAVHVDSGLLDRSGVSIGGGADDEFQIQDAPARLAEIHADGEALQLSFPSPPLGDQAWVMEIFSERRFGGRRSTLHGSVALAPGDGLCVTNCEWGAASWVTLVQDGAGRRLAAAGRERSGPVLIRPPLFPKSPERLTEWLSARLHTAYAPSRRIFPLRDILPETACPTDAGCANLRSFLWDSSEGLRLVVLDPQVSVDASGEVRQLEPALPPRTLAEGDQLAIWRVDLAPSGFDVANRDDVASRLRGRTRFQMERTDDGATISLPDAAVMALRRRDIARELGNTDNDRLTSGGMGDANAQLSFPELGGAAAGGAQGAIYIPADLLANRAVASIEIESRREGAFQREHVLLGRPFVFQDAGARPAFTLTQETLPWSLIGLALIGWLILVLCQYRLWQTQRLTWMLATGVQLLLALRFVVAIEAAYIDLTVDAAVRLHQATLAFVLGGGVMALVAAGHVRKQAALVGIALISAATIVHSVAERAFVGWEQLGLLVIFIVAIPLVLWLERLRKPESEAGGVSWPARLWRWLRDRTQGLRNRVSSVAQRVASFIRPAPWFWMLALVVVVRLVLALAGVREREAIALSAFYLPPMLLVAALALKRASDGSPAKGENIEWLCCLGVLLASGATLIMMILDGPGQSPIWLGYQAAVLLLAAAALWALVRHAVRSRQALPRGARRPPIAWWGGWCFVGVLGLMGVVVPAVVRDVGFAPLILAPLGVAAWIALGPSARKASSAPRLGRVWIAPLIFCIALLALPRAVAMVSDESAQVVAAGQAESNDAALSVLERSVGLTQNPLRILLLSDPDQARQTGTSQAESLSWWSSYLEDFTREPFGHGYLADVRLGPLAENHEDDNLSAVHLMSPYGRFGALVFLAWLGTLAACAARVRPGTGEVSPSARTTRDLVGLFALWTPFVMAAYMILANLQVIPFTGRNVYLLAAFSGSDWVEGMTLFGGALWLLGRSGPQSAAPAQKRTR